MLGLVLGKIGDLSQAYVTVGTAKIMWGNFISVMIDFVIIAVVVYFIFKRLGFEKLDKK